MGLTHHEVTMAFCQSRFTVIDCVKDLHRNTTLGLPDFMEALARIADFVTLPRKEEVEKEFGGDMLKWRQDLDSQTKTKEVSHVITEEGIDDRHLADKLALFLPLLFAEQKDSLYKDEF